MPRSRRAPDCRRVERATVERGAPDNVADELGGTTSGARISEHLPDRQGGTEKSNAHAGFSDAVQWLCSAGLAARRCEAFMSTEMPAGDAPFVVGRCSKATCRDPRALTNEAPDSGPRLPPPASITEC